MDTGARAHHTPVMVSEVLAGLKVRSDGTYIDSTVGEGGHALAVLGAAEPGARLLGIDLDAEALSTASSRLEAHRSRVTLARGSYTAIQQIAEEHDFMPADGVLFDLGVSALQLESAERGFSFSRSGTPDMRFDLRQELTAYDLVNRNSEEELANMIFRYGEERRSRRIARAIVVGRPIESTVDLASVIAHAAGRSTRGGIHPATRTFQALRIAVNGELENLRSGLERAIEVLRSGGRLVVISYHSIEDRLVKSMLRRESSSCVCPPGTPQCVCGHQASLKIITRRVVRPSTEEVLANPRSRSARLRVAERL